MTSLSDTYSSGPIGAVWNRRQLIVGVSLFTAGSVMIIASILAAASDVFINLLEITVTESWEVAGILGGIGVPSVIVGVFMVLPSSRRQRFGAAIGLAIAFIGVLLFFNHFPNQWHGDTPDHTLRVVTVYFTGLLITLGNLFYSVANFKTRNDPGGTVNLQLSLGGESHEVEVSRDQLRGDNSPNVLRSTDSDALDNHADTQAGQQNRNDAD